MNVFEAAKLERKRQIDGEGFSAERDDQYVLGDLALAASAYASHVSFQQRHANVAKVSRPGVWPWADAWWKPSNDKKRNIVKAMALLAAEYERLERLGQ